MIELRDYQKKAVVSILKAWNQQEVPYVNIITGGGKSLVIADIIKRSLKLGYRVLNLVPTMELAKQNYEECFNYIDDKHDLGIYCAGLNKRQGHKKAIIAMTDSFLNARFKCGKFDVLIIDETDLVSYCPKTKYRRIIDALKLANPNIRIAGVTGSPYRMGTGLLENPHPEHGASVFTVRSFCTDELIPDMIEKGYISNIESLSGDIQADLSNVKLNSIGEYNTELMAAKFDAIIPHAVRDMVIKFNANDIKTAIVFASSLDNARKIIDEYKEVTSLDNIRLVSGDSEKKHERKQNIDWLANAPGQRILVNVGILTRGYNYRALDCIVFMRATQSLALYVQCLDYKTEILTINGWKKHGEISVNDTVAGFNIATNKPEWQSVTNVFDRPVYDGEKFIKINSGSMDVRVTDNHNMVVKSRGAVDWMLEQAKKSIKRNTGVLIPISADMDIQDNELTNSQLSFIGWFLTDGTRNKKNNAISISQREAAIENESIVASLNECCFRYGIHVTKRKGIVFGKDASRYDNLIRYSVSYGDARVQNGTGIYGWNILEKWIDKTIPECFNTLSKRQLLIMLKSMDMANGSKKQTSWTQKTMDISVGHNKVMADRIQEICVLRGLRCNIKSYNTLILSISDKCVSHVKGSKKYDLNNNQVMEYSDADNSERVWCVETPLKTIFTRRNGKVAILGNCIGRVIRSNDDKECGYVIDYGGNIDRHGAIDDIKPPEPKKKGTKAVQKECISIATKVFTKTINEVDYTLIPGIPCGFMNHASAKKCVLCESEFVADPDAPGGYSMRSHAEILALKEQKRQKRHEVNGVYFDKQLSKSGFWMIVVKYYYDNQLIHRQFLCLDRHGYPRHSAIKFLKAWAKSQNEINELNADNLLSTDDMLRLLEDSDTLERYFKKIIAINLKSKPDSKYKDLVSVEFE